MKKNEQGTPKLHHQVAKKAKAAGISVKPTEDPKDGWVALNLNRSVSVIGTDAKTVVALAVGLKDITAGLRNVHVKVVVDAQEINMLFKHIDDKDEREFLSVETEKDGDAALAALLAGVSISDLREQIAEECGVEIGTKSPAETLRRYRDVYALDGHPNHCGDWLAETLDARFLDFDSKFDVDAFNECLRENGVEFTGKWANLPNSNKRGWQGRYRMNGRAKLEVKVAVHGWLKLDGELLTPPQSELRRLREKHAKHLKEIEEAAKDSASPAPADVPEDDEAQA